MHPGAGGLQYFERKICADHLTIQRLTLHLLRQ